MTNPRRFRVTASIIVLLFFTAQLKAQWGLSAGYRLNNSSGWVLEDRNDAGSAFDFPANGPSFGLDYEFRLKTIRLVIAPELNVAYFRSKGPDNSISQSVFTSLFLNGRFYFLDLYGDCDCPTWSKQGDLLKKGLFMQVSPGLTYMNNKMEVPPVINSPDTQDPQVFKNEGLAFSIGVGLGLDIGVSDMLTITPMMEARYFPSMKWEGLSEAWPVVNSNYGLMSEENSMWQVAFSLRFGLRLDQ